MVTEETQCSYFSVDVGVPRKVYFVGSKNVCRICGVNGAPCGNIWLITGTMGWTFDGPMMVHLVLVLRGQPMPALRALT
jgi:hypothetical protein